MLHETNNSNTSLNWFLLKSFIKFFKRKTRPTTETKTPKLIKQKFPLFEPDLET